MLGFAVASIRTIHAGKANPTLRKRLIMRALIVISVAAAILLPVLIGHGTERYLLLFGLEDRSSGAAYTPRDLLDYAGVFLSLLLAWFTYRYERESSEQEELDKFDPALNFVVNMVDGTLEFSVTNHSPYPAYNIRIFGFWAFPAIMPKETLKRNFQLNYQNQLYPDSPKAKAVTIVNVDEKPKTKNGTLSAFPVQVTSLRGNTYSFNYELIPGGGSHYQPIKQA